MATVNTTDTIDLNSVLYLFNGDFFATKMFKSLLNAIANDNFNDLSSGLTDEVVYNYVRVRPIVESYIKNVIYERLYKNDMYDGLINSLIDLFACMATIVYMRRSIADIDIQPNDVVNEYLKSFGIPCMSLFDTIQKRAICKNVYMYLRKKGTPELLKVLLQQLGFDYFCILEYWLTTDNYGTYIAQPEIISQISTLKVTNDWQMYFKNKTYSMTQMRNMDPLWTLEDSDISSLVTNDTMTLPAKTSYYQIGVAISSTYNDKLISSMLYAIAKKCLYENSINNDVKDVRYEPDVTNSIRYEPYTAAKISALDLIYSWAMISDAYSPTYDIFGLNVTAKSNKFDIDGKLKKFDMDMAYDTISKRSIVERYHDTDVSFDEDGIYFDTLITDHLITEKVFGWNGDITTSPIGEILKEIKVLYDNTFDMIKYYPSRIVYDTATEKIKIDSNKTRLESVTEIEDKYFISNALFGDIDDTLAAFKVYNPSFYSWCETQLAIYEDGTSEKIELCTSMLIYILKTLERYIYAKCGIKFNLKQYLISQTRFRKMALQLGKGFMPYHAFMIDPFYVFVIRELPFDQILVSDMDEKHISGPLCKAHCMERDAFWRAEYQQLYDVTPGEAYAPIYDWKQKTLYPIFTGYDTSRTITVNGKIYAPVYDFQNDLIKIYWGNSKLSAYSGYKSKLPTHIITTNTKQQFVVEVDAQLNEFTIWSKEGNDLTSARKIMYRIGKSLWKIGYNVITVEETFYNEHFDNTSVDATRTLPNVESASADMNTFDDPRWNDRFDTIHISHTDTLPASSGYINIGSLLVSDLMYDAS